MLISMKVILVLHQVARYIITCIKLITNYNMRHYYYYHYATTPTKSTYTYAYICINIFPSLLFLSALVQIIVQFLSEGNMSLETSILVVLFN